MRCVYVVVWSALASSCIDAELVPCANGVSCPTGLVCDEAHKTCVTREQATACLHALENAPCLENGACHHGVCVPIECGNWLRDPLEMCDDGNTLSGDGCSADCTTDETCGNGVIDPARGETCDLGDLASHDGCDSQCRTEAPTFTPLVQSDARAVELAGFAFDDARGKLVMFGGSDPLGARVGDTLEIDGVTRTFVVRTPDVAPLARYGPAMAYDAKRSVVVLFGGSEASGPVGDTWTWDGERWRVLTPATAPPPRVFAGMTYDSRRKRVLMFGGRGATGVLADLWSWDGTTWTELQPPASPPPRERTMFAYDPIHDRVVLFGGAVNGAGLGDMWVFDGAAWTALSPPGIPAGRLGGTLTFDPARGGLVLIGGTSMSPAYLWDGNQWLVIGVSTTPMSQRIHHVAFFDPAIGSTVAGLGAIASTIQSDLYRLDNDAWSALAIAGGPPRGDDVSIAFDARRGEAVMFGGMVGGLPTQQMWLHDGRAWVEKVSTDPPSARANAAMAYDERRGRIVLFGGNILGGTPDPDVYEWDGLTWVRIVAPGPPARRRSQLAYDPVSETVVLFGGDGPSGRLGDTWQWNGSTWTEVTTSPSPSVRAQHMLGYVRGRIVLFGGADVDGGRLGDTWTWTAAGGWVQEAPLASPSPRVRGVMASDPVREELVLFGGAVSGGLLGDTWAWDGTTWNRRFPDDPAPAMDNAAATYDAARRHTLIHGAAGTYRLQWRGEAADEACRTAIDRDGDRLVGCADPDCAGYCTPLCPGAAPFSACAGPVCGDQTCSPLESCRLCRGDCGFCDARCGDGYCDGGEACSGECPS